METCLKLASTLATEAVVDPIWDAIVIGSGPAGAVTARQLAASGRTTLLVDRQPFPRAKVCGGYLNGRAVSVLRSLGLNDALAAARPVAVRQFVLQTNRHRATLDLSAGVVIRRDEFDATLVRAAIGAGAHFLPETRATIGEPTASADFRPVQLSAHGGQTFSARGRVIVAADGLGHPCLPRAAEFACQARPTSRVGVGITFSDSSSAYDSGVIYMAVAREGYCGLVRTAGGELNMAAALDASAVKASGDPAQAVRRVLEKAGLPPIASLPVEGWRGTPALTRASATLASSRVFVVGDAAGYVEPFTGEGMAWAIDSSAAAARCILQSPSGWDERLVALWQSAQRSRMRRGQLACRLLAAALRKPLVVGTAVNVLSRLPALARPFVRHISARSYDLKASSS
jgi:menaquinone-9 beta-reductase